MPPHSESEQTFTQLQAVGLQVIAARGGTVIGVRESGSQSCFDPNTRTCPNCMGAAVANRVRVQHQDGTVGVYFHFQQNGVVVTQGQRIHRGYGIGYVGNTGCSTDPHLHFEVLGSSTTGATIRILFEAYDQDSVLRNCHLPGHNSNGFSNNLPWFAD